MWIESQNEESWKQSKTQQDHVVSSKDVTSMICKLNKAVKQADPLGQTYKKLTAMYYERIYFEC